jgi:hypothetical protein
MTDEKQKTAFDQIQDRCSKLHGIAAALVLASDGESLVTKKVTDEMLYFLSVQLDEEADKILELASDPRAGLFP